jgi:hypothetical protein
MGRCEYPMRGVSADRGSPLPQCPAVRRNGDTAVMLAAINDHHAIVERLVVARADLNTKHSRHGCALARGPSGDICWSPTLPIVPAPSGRFTALHLAARWGYTKSAVPLLVGGADQTVTDKIG